MIVFDLECRDNGHRFEGWFGSSDDYARQQERGLVTCPTCGSADVGKAVMAPAVGRKGNQLPAPSAKPAEKKPMAAGLPPKAAAMLRTIATMQAEAIKNSTWVGDKFADDARAMHYGEKDHALIHGQATPDEAQELLEEGIGVAPLLIPVVPPEQAN
jgi:hypothetical protein